MTSPSGGPYEVGDDTVAARLEVDIPNEAIQSLTEVNRLTADLRANMEATAKYSQDYSQYLRDLPNALGEVGSAQSRLASSEASIFGGGDMTPVADPFAGRGTGPGHTSYSGSGSGRPMRGVDEDALIELARDNPRQVANMAADRGLDEYFDEGVNVLPRPAPGPRPSAGRGRQFSGGSGPPSTPRSPRASTGPGDDDGRSAGTTTGRQVTPEGTESQAERAAKRLLAELDKGADNRDAGQRIRDFGQGVGGNSLLNSLNNEFSGRGGTDALSFAGSLGRMGQQSAENLTSRATGVEEQRQNLLAQAAEVAATNPALAEQLTQRAQGLAGTASGLGRLAPLAKGVGLAGAAVAGAAGINAAVQKTGETIHGFQGTGIQMGGGIAEGAAFEAQIRTMAMNPFISVEQSRKIMQSALQTGYTGKEFDTVTEFMAENLKSMNLEVAESTKLLQQNVLKGGQSLESVQAQLSGNVALAREGDLTTGQVNQQYTQISGQGVSAGGGGAESGEFSQQLIAMTSSDPILKEQGATDLANAGFNNRTFQSMLAAEAGVVGETTTESTASYLLSQDGGAEKLARAERDTIKKGLMNYALQYANGDSMAKSVAVRNAGTRLKAYGINWDQNMVANVLKSIADGTWDQQTESGIEQAKQVSGGDMETESSMETFWGAAGDRFTGAAKKTFHSMIGNEEGVERAQEDLDRGEQGFKRWTPGSDTYVPTVLEDLASAHHNESVRDVEYIDEEGNAQKIGEKIRDEGFMKRLQSGDVKIKVPGQEEATTLGEWGNAQQSELAAGSGNMFGIQVDLSNEAKRLLNITVTEPTREQQNADRGVGARNDDANALNPFGPNTGQR